MSLTIRERADAYNDSAWGRKYPASRLAVVQERGGPCLYATRMSTDTGLCCEPCRNRS